MSDVNHCEACRSGGRIDLRRFFPFLGSKWRLAMNYPPPKHDLIIEPFAGSAGYSVSYHRHQVLLVEKDPVIFSVWDYLIKSSREEILSLPIPSFDQDLYKLDISEPARYLIGYWSAFSPVQPSKRSMSKKTSQGCGSCWRESHRSRLADQVEHIKHWNIVCGEFHSVENFNATWFIDPPYHDRTGEMYRHKRSSIGQEDLLDFCVSRLGQVIVCEGAGAGWLPYEVIYEGRSESSKKNHSQLVFSMG